MPIKSKNQISANFSLSSMTDIVFLLLIFFMLTSNFVTPSALPVNLPSSKGTSLEMTKMTVTVTSDLRCYFNDKEVSFDRLERTMAAELGGQEGLVTLHIDKSVPHEYFMKVAGICAANKAKVSVAAQPE